MLGRMVSLGVRPKVEALLFWCHGDYWQRFNLDIANKLTPTSAWRRVSGDDFSTRRGPGKLHKLTRFGE